MLLSIRSLSTGLNSQDLAKSDPISQFGATASVFATAKHKKEMACLDKYKMKKTGVVQKLQDLVFDEKLAEFKKLVEQIN